MSEVPRPPKMTTEAFLAWAVTQQQRYELVDGEAVAMAPERVAHAQAKFRIARKLAEAIEAAGLPCQTFTDGMAVAIDSGTSYEPDALVRCGPPLPDEAITITDPLIVVEVVSPSSSGRDAGAKLADYFRLLTVRHYLIVMTERRTMIHHRRDRGGLISTRTMGDGPSRWQSVVLEPPGITLHECFPPA